jgi:hypothetical protein
MLTTEQGDVDIYTQELSFFKHHNYSPFTEYSSFHKSYRSLSITIIPLLQSIQQCARVFFL